MRMPFHALGRAWIEHAGERLDQLEPVEQALLSPRATSKRRDEFVAGRLAAREAFERLVEADPRLPLPFAILSERSGDEQGRPRPVGQDLRGLPLHVSISHCATLALAVASEQPCGLDIVRIEAQPRGFADDAFDPRELASWSVALDLDPDHPEVLAHAFAAKEALVKWVGRGFGLAMQAATTTPVAPLEREGDIEAELIGAWEGQRRRFAVRRWFEDGLLVVLAF
jgi:phosphopantetheinyl transferase